MNTPFYLPLPLLLLPTSLVAVLVLLLLLVLVVLQLDTKSDCWLVTSHLILILWQLLLFLSPSSLLSCLSSLFACQDSLTWLKFLGERVEQGRVFLLLLRSLHQPFYLDRQLRQPTQLPIRVNCDRHWIHHLLSPSRSHWINSCWLQVSFTR